MADKPHVQAARRSAAQQTARLAELPATRFFYATVTQASPLKVLWRGQEVAARRGSTYTPVVGHRVICALLDNQPVVLDAVV